MHSENCYKMNEVILINAQAFSFDVNIAITLIKKNSFKLLYGGFLRVTQVCNKAERLGMLTDEGIHSSVVTDLARKAGGF